MARIATQLMLGRKLADLNLVRRAIPHYGVKEAVFPFNMLPEVDPLLGPEMRSTGEVLGMADTFGMAFFKAQEAAQQALPLEGTVLITVAGKDRPAVVEVARHFAELGFRILATTGTAACLAQHGISSQVVNKTHEGRPHIVDFVKNREIHLIINTPAGKQSQYDDSYIRKNAVKYKVPYITTLAGALAAAKGIAARRQPQSGALKSLQEYHADIQDRA
jgi:carbamoyl-phosphate synthase large subunit